VPGDLEADYIVIPGHDHRHLRVPEHHHRRPVLKLAMPAPEAFPHGEERRLFYVALTRARRAVVLITHPRRMPRSSSNPLKTLWGARSLPGL